MNMQLMMARARMNHQTSSVFDPSSLSPTVWYNDTSPITGMSTCSQWNDISGNNFHMTQASTGAQPAIVPAAKNGRRALAFTSDYMTVGSVPIMRNASQGWIFCVYSVTATSIATQGLCDVRTNNGAFGRFAAYSNSSRNLRTATILSRTTDGGAASFLDSTDTMATGWHYYLAYKDWAVGNGYIYIDGSLNNSGAMGATGATDNTNPNYTIIGGESPSSNMHQGNIAEVIIGQTALTALQISNLQTWAAAKWAL